MPSLRYLSQAVALSLLLLSATAVLAAQHPSFQQFASPIPQFTISKSTISFPGNQSTDSILVSMTDSAIYRYVNTSFNGQSWVQTTLLSGTPSTCTTHPDDTGGTWLTGTCTLTVPVAAANFSFSAQSTSRTRNYITAYSCTENVLDLGIVRFRLGWDCHGTTGTPSMWQIWNFTVSLAAATPTCSDGVQNGDETGVDCGGPCPACSTSASFLRTFYVSNSSGLDTNNGTDSGHPWKTIAKVNSYAFQPGDGILFKRGDTWTGTTAISVSHSGNSTHQITYGAYGVGAKPIFNFLSSLNSLTSLSGWNLDWARNGNIWSKSVSSDKKYRLWLSGTEVKRHVNSAVNSTEPWYLAEGGTTLYVYTTDTLGPAHAFTNIQAIEVENVFKASSSNADYITIQNLDIQGAYYAINFGGTLGWIIENCSIGWNSNVAIHSWPGYLGATRSFTGNVIIRNNMLDSGDRIVDAYMWNNEYEGISQRDGANNWDIYNNTLLDWTHGALALYEATVGHPMINVKYHNNFISSKDIDYGYGLVYNAKPNLGACYGNEVYNNYIYSSGTTAIQINGDGLKIYNNIIDTVRYNGYEPTGITAASGLVMQSYSGLDSDNLLYNNVFVNCYYAGVYIKYYRNPSPPPYAETKRNVIANNVFYNNGLYDLRYEYTGDNGASIGSNIIKNNLFYKYGSTTRIFYEKMAGTQAITVAQFNAQNGITTNLQSGEVADVITNNIYGDPLFVDANNANYLLRNYHLNSGSPAKWTGFNMGLLKDYEGSNYNNPTPSMGAFEYISTCTPNCAGKACGSDGCGSSCGTCALGNANSTCNATYQCAVSSCTSGYANCNGRSSDGCEVQLGMNATCANCTNACTTGQTCTNYVCTTPQSGTCGGATCKTGEYCSNNACLLQVQGSTYFVATTGNDNWPGTFAQPWATWQKAFSTANAGDIVYFRGGVWYPAGAAYGNNIIMVNPPGGLGHSGTLGNPIHYFNYPGESPVLDCSLINPSGSFNTGLELNRMNFVNFRGLTIRNVHQPRAGVEAFGMVMDSCTNLHLENMIIHDIGGNAYRFNGVPLGYYESMPYDNNYFINCEAYNNYDLYAAKPGNAADGFKAILDVGEYAYYYGCRSWNNSDDGFDVPGPGIAQLENCWSFDNGWWDSGNEGNGYKFGAVGTFISNETHHKIITKCIAANNRGIGFADIDYEPYYRTNALIYNNLAYKEGNGCQANSYTGTPRTTTYRNNIVYDSQTLGPVGVPDEVLIPYIPYPESNNTWIWYDASPGSYPWWKYNPAYNVTDADFVSLNVSQLYLPRKADNSLPDVTFGHLAPGSELIDGGMIIPGYHCATAGAHPGQNCVEWYGSAPDIGAFEYAG
jgi:hypothetical protein